MTELSAQSYFSVDFGEYGGQFHWTTHEDVVNWISALREQWGWVSKQAAAQTAAQKINSALKQVLGPLSAAKSNQELGQKPQAEANLALARSTLESLVRSNPWLLPDSARRIWVEGIRDSGQPLEAALIVAHWLGQDINGAPVRQVVSAMLMLELHERGIKDRVKSESAALKRLAGDMQTTLAQMQESDRTQSHRFETLHTQLSEQSSAQQGTFVTSQDGRDAEWKKQLAENQTALDGLRDTYDKFMALKGPVDYWEQKRKGHGRLAVVSFVAMVACMGAFGWFLHTELQDVGKAVEANRVAKQATATTKTPDVTNAKGTSVANTTATSTSAGLAKDQMVAAPGLFETAATWKIGSFVLLATLSFWFIRLLVRIFLSNLHLENDAAERVTMAKTYLALLRDGSLQKDSSISTVLAALFRPTGDGIVKDEGLPPTAMEWITKLGGK